MAPLTDPNLNNPWGIAFTSGGSPFWVSDEATVRANPNPPPTNAQVATLYGINVNTGPSINALVVPVLNVGNAPPDPVGMTNGPTGMVTPGASGIVNSSPTTDFQIGASQANFIFANLDGSISAWRGGLTPNQAVIETFVPNAAFSGLAIGNNGAGALQIYAADQASPNIAVFNGQWHLTSTTFTDPTLPSGFTAFNVQNLGGTLFVTYANQANPLGGIVDEYTTDGVFIKRLVTDTAGLHLDQPWGLVIAPASFGMFGGDLLVGNNNGDGHINAYSLTNGTWLGSLALFPSGQPFSEGDLWMLTFGSGVNNGGLANTLYFTAGLSSQVDGLLGAISAVPEPGSLLLGVLAAAICGPLALRHRRRRRARQA
jgi:uncharacterized protein (TIGR03118 family)